MSLKILYLISKNLLFINMYSWVLSLLYICISTKIQNEYGTKDQWFCSFTWVIFYFILNKCLIHKNIVKEFNLKNRKK